MRFAPLMLTAILGLWPVLVVAAGEVTPLYTSDFPAAGYGHAPPGWRDLIDRRPSRNWAVDGKAMLRPMLKDYSGVIVYDGAVASGEKARELKDAVIVATFTKTEDPEVFFGLAARVRDKDNCYAARVVGDSLLELHRHRDGKSDVLASLATLKRYRHGDAWRLELGARGDVITAILRDDNGMELARVDGKDDALKSGWMGVTATTYGAAKAVEIRAVQPYTPKLTAEQIAARNREAAAAAAVNYPVFKPAENVDALNTPADKIADSYDVIVAGAGTGGSAAAIQAARLGASVLLLDETEYIGGQMTAGGVTAMDESAAYGLRIVRERGIYREFHESMATYYYTLDKDPFRGDRSFGDPNSNAGYEPKIARAGLYAMIADARQKARLDVSLRSRVVEVAKTGNTITGAMIEVAGASGTQRKSIRSKVLIDATEYGDVIPLTGARYRVGNVTSDHVDPTAAVQDHTWVAVIREYPDGVPAHLQIREAPPGYGDGPRAFLKYRNWGALSWGKEAKGAKEFQYRVYTGYRSLPDTNSPLVGEAGEHRNTLTSINGGNDYPVTVATIENLEQRARDERDGIYRTLGVISYYQHDLGAKWSVAEDQGYDSPANRAYMKKLGIRADLIEVASRMPPLPYVRESRRIIGTKTLVARELGRFENATHFATSVAMGDYFMDLHGTEDVIESELDSGDVPKGGGPFQVPFECFIPETLDGFVPAEKNISQSRLVSGATRMQPSTMLTGQAAGAIAALAARQQKQPRQLDPKQVQRVLLDAGSTLVQRWYGDVPWGTPVWRATQLLSLHRVMDRDGAIDKRADNLGATRKWGVDEPLDAKEMRTALARIAELRGVPAKGTPTAARGAVTWGQVRGELTRHDAEWVKAIDTSPARADGDRVTAGEFAIVAARIVAR